MTDKRDLPEIVRANAHEKLDEALDMYQRGEPLWINTGFQFGQFNGPGFHIDIFIKEPLP